ncbi:hypothetical protein QQP08_015121 [Theobroma cacao]|nr:hypothetical protein QQP08_015121 [Theobroma cacao]
MGFLERWGFVYFLRSKRERETERSLVGLSAWKISSFFSGSNLWLLRRRGEKRNKRGIVYFCCACIVGGFELKIEFSSVELLKLGFNRKSFSWGCSIF